jgi:hypothetical protein
MTTFEHAMLGINGSLALGLHQKYSWRIVALAGIAAVAPDWDGIPMLFDMQRFESGHRVWGHNVLACVLLGILIAGVDLRLQMTGWIVKQFAKFAPTQSKQTTHHSLKLGEDSEGLGSTELKTGNSRTVAWILVAILATMSQIPADMVVSGGKGLSDWALQPFWPFAETECVYPLIAWGNIGVTVIFSIAMIGQASRPRLVQPIAIFTLILMVVYLVSWQLWSD